MKQDYFLFLDESGDHGLNKIDPSFPAFILCGVMMSQGNYAFLDSAFNHIKNKFWESGNVIFHSRDIRKWQKEFSILVDPTIREGFYRALDASIVQSQYAIIASAIRKKEYIKRYGVLSDVYAVSLSFVIERAIFYLDQKTDVAGLNILIEKRGKKEDAQLLRYFNKLYDSGTSFVSSARIKAVVKNFDFVDKKDNENGLQLSDLTAYPIATHIIDPSRANPAFDVLEKKFYAGRRGNYLGYGLKIFP